MQLEKLKQLRIYKGYSVQTMANMLGISKTYYWQLENGKRRLSYQMAIEISNIFKSKPDNIFYGAVKKSI